jgi:hypothetical protein
MVFRSLPVRLEISLMLSPWLRMSLISKVSPPPSKNRTSETWLVTECFFEGVGDFSSGPNGGFYNRP